MTLPNLGQEFDRLVALLMQSGYDEVLRRFKAELARGRLSTLTQWVQQGFGRGALLAWSTHARWLAIGSVPGRDIMESLGASGQNWAGTVETRALAVFGRGQSPLEPPAYLNLLAGIAVRAGYHSGAEAAGEAGRAKFKMWIRSYSGRGEHRHWHDALNGAAIPASSKFVLPGGPNPGAKVDGPHDWASLPSPAEWANCGHALIYVPDATKEDLIRGVRVTNVPMAGPNIPSGANSPINKRQAVRMATGLAQQAGFQTDDASEYFARHARSAIAAYDESADRILLNLGHTYWSNAVAYARMRYEAGFWSSPDPMHVILHEIGHGLYLRANPGTSNVWPLGFLKELRATPSQQAGSGRLEWIAEVYVMRRLNLELAKDVLDWYLRLGGPEP